LAEFLKSVLDIPGDELEELTIIDPYIEMESKDDKYGILDVKVHTKKGIVIDVEIQVDRIPDMKKRMIYNLSKMITEQISSGNKWAPINRAIVIVITDYPFVEESEEYHHEFRYRTKVGLEFSNLTEFNVLDLSRLPRNADNSEL
jgi:predicted transposase/invertase (TIGR01784 family)